MTKMISNLWDCVDLFGRPADAALEVKEIADYVSPIDGGHGAVRDVIEYYFKKECCLVRYC